MQAWLKVCCVVVKPPNQRGLSSVKVALEASVSSSRKQYTTVHVTLKDSRHTQPFFQAQMSVACGPSHLALWAFATGTVAL